MSINNQDAFDLALLHLLNQGHRCVSSTGRSLLRAPRGGKSAIGALIPDRLYVNSMEGKTVQQLLAANGPGFDQLREYWSGVTPSLLTELQDLHDRTGECLPSMFRDIVLAGGQRIARMFRLATRMIQLWSAYRKVSGPRLPWKPAPVVVESVGAGAWQNSANAAVSVSHAAPTQPEPVTPTQAVTPIEPVTSTQPVTPTQPAAQPESVIPPKPVTSPAPVVTELHLPQPEPHHRSETTMEQLRLLEALFRPRDSGT